jgi:ASPIC and UnbV
MACGDLSGRADRACLVMTDSGALLLRDGLTPRGRWVGLRLQGTVSAVDATGARVSVLGAERPQVYYYGAQAPFGASHERSLVVGIGARDTADFEVRWPSGIRQRLSAVAAGRYTTVVEPATVTLSRRVAPADGRSEVEVIVDAAAAGATTASLSARGPGSLSDEGADAGGRHRWRVIAPTAAGEAVLTVLLDGTALRVRPRVRFTSPQGS